jgi:NADH-quinone oxidoreductase subunit G
MSEPIKVTINGKEIETEKGAVLIDVCRDNENSIPSFCYYKDLEVQASCRMCLVRIDKMPKLQTSCTIKCTDGMVVTTESPEIEKAQRRWVSSCSPIIRSIARFAIAAANASCRK